MSKSKVWLTVAFSVIAAHFAPRASYSHTLNSTNKIKFNTVAYDHVAESDRLYYPEDGWLWKVDLAEMELNKQRIIRLCAKCWFTDIAVSRDESLVTGIYVVEQQGTLATWRLVDGAQLAARPVGRATLLEVGDQHAVLEYYPSSGADIRYELIALLDLAVLREFPSLAESYPNHRQRFGFVAGENYLAWHRNYSNSVDSPDCHTSLLNLDTLVKDYHTTSALRGCYSSHDHVVTLPSTGELLINSSYVWDYRAGATRSIAHLTPPVPNLYINGNAVTTLFRNQLLVRKDLGEPLREGRVLLPDLQRGGTHIGKTRLLTINLPAQEGYVVEPQLTELSFEAALDPASKMLSHAWERVGQRVFNLNAFQNNLSYFDLKSKTWVSVYKPGSIVPQNRITYFEWDSARDLFSIFGWYNVSYFTNLHQVLPTSSGQHCTSPYLTPQNRKPAVPVHLNQESLLVTNYIPGKAQVLGKWDCQLKSEVEFKFDTSDCREAAMTKDGVFYCRTDRGVLFSYDVSSQTLKTVTDRSAATRYDRSSDTYAYLKEDAQGSAQLVMVSSTGAHTSPIPVMAGRTHLGSGSTARIAFIGEQALAVFIDNQIEIYNRFTGGLIKILIGRDVEAVLPDSDNSLLVLERYAGNLYRIGF